MEMPFPPKQPGSSRPPHTDAIFIPLSCFALHCFELFRIAFAFFSFAFSFFQK